MEDLGFEQRMMQTLETAGELDRAVEFLPDDMTIAEHRRHSQPLTRPELAVLMAYAKLALNHHLVMSRVPDDPYLVGELTRYFPIAVDKRFPDDVARHRLRRRTKPAGKASKPAKQKTVRKSPCSLHNKI